MLHDDLKKAAKKLREKAKYVKKRTMQNIKDASKEMVLKAKEATPPKNGEERGKNTVTGHMAAHWKAKPQKLSDGNIKVTLKNDIVGITPKYNKKGEKIGENIVHYASYVDQGHKMTEHFVPWLYKDGTNTLARHEPVPGEKLFGLVVGNKTEYVPGYKIVEQAKDRFFEAYEHMQKGLVDEINNSDDFK